MSLDFLGAGEGLGTRYITVRVKSIDTDKLAQKVGQAAKAVAAADAVPEIALRTAMPLAANLVRNDYGVDLDWQLSKAPPNDAGELEKNTGFSAGRNLGIGIGLGAAATAWLLSRLF